MFACDWGMKSFQVVYHADSDGNPEGGCWYSARTPWAALLLDIASLSLELPTIQFNTIDNTFTLTYTADVVTGYVAQARS